VVCINKKGCKNEEGAELMCYTRRDEATEYEALRLAEKQANMKGQTKPPRESREKKPLTRKVKEMIGASR
jgi:hypothetical protein